MPYINIDVDLDDIYDDMSTWEKKQLAEWLSDDGFCFLDQSEGEFVIENPSILDLDWIANIHKIFHGRLMLTNEDAELIRTIANKL